MLRGKSRALPVLSLHRVMGQGILLSFSQRAIEILRSMTKLSTLSWYLLSLSYFFLKHFYDRLRKQGRKAVKCAFHFRDRGKNAWLRQIFQCKVNTFISNFSVNIFSLKCS